jgi:adenylyltransferase and sulfurtransferase
VLFHVYTSLLETCRCIFPECPAPQHCSRCDVAGVLGPVPGVIGTLQALECIKLLSKVGQPLRQSLLIYDALTARFTTVRLRSRRPDCLGCSPGSEIRRVPGGTAGYDYVNFTGEHAGIEAKAGGSLLGEGRVTVSELRAILGGEGDQGNVLLLDVRPKELFECARLKDAMHIAMNEVSLKIGVPLLCEESLEGCCRQKVIVNCGSSSVLVPSQGTHAIPA